MSARVSKVEIFEGVPEQYVPRMAIRPGMPVTIPYHCRAQYAYLVDGTLYPGWFALLAKSLTEAQGLARGLQNLTIQLKYDPLKPADSALEESRILEKKVVQSGTNPLNPTVW